MGREFEIRSPKDAYDLGIGMIHQHFKLIDVFSATENIALGLDKKAEIRSERGSEKSTGIFVTDIILNLESEPEGL